MMRVDTYLGERTFRAFTIFDILERRKLWKAPVTFASIMGGSALVCLFFRSVSGACLLAASLGTIALGLPLVYFTTFFSSLKKQTKARNLNPPRLVYSLNLGGEEEGIHIENGREKADYRWKDAFMAYRREDCVYLFITPQRAFLLTKPSDELWALIEEEMGREKCRDIRKRRGGRSARVMTRGASSS